MTNEPIDEEMPAEIDFSKGKRGRHHIAPEAAVYLPVSIERKVLQYFTEKAERKGVAVSQLLSEVLNRDIEINEAMQ